MGGERWSIWAIVFAGILGWVAILQYVRKLLKTSERNRKQQETTASSLPFPPGSWPLVGHLHQLFLSGEPLHKWLHTLSQRHGPIVRLQLGCVPTLVASSPDAARLFLHMHDLVFASRSTRSFNVRLFSYNFSGLSTTPYGPYWRKVKELYMTKLLNSQRMQQFKPMRAREAEGLVRSVWEGRGGAQDVRAKLQVRACDLMSRMVVGRSFGELESITRTSGPVILGTFYEALDAVGTPNVTEFLPGPLHRLHLQPLRVRRTRSTFRRLDSIFQRIIDHRRERDSPASDHRGHHDLLDTLLAQHVDATHLLPGQPRFTDDNIKAIFWDMFLGGTDTSTVAVEWGLAELVRHPSAMKRLREELDSVVGNSGRLIAEDDITGGLPYLQAVVKETLRLHPVVPLLVPHESTEPCEVGGFYVAKGTRLIVNAWSLAMDETYWDKPSEFLPQRFLDSDVDLRGHHLQFLPFGTGRRACPAINLGLLNVYLMLAALVQCFDWSLPPDVRELDMSDSLDIVLHRSHPLLLIASPRLPTEFYLSLGIAPIPS